MTQIKKDTTLRKSILQAAITGQLISNVEGTTETVSAAPGNIMRYKLTAHIDPVINSV